MLMVGINQEGLRQTLHPCHYLAHIGRCFMFGKDKVLFDVIGWFMHWGKKWSKIIGSRWNNKDL